MVESRPVDAVFCPNCGAVISRYAVYCAHCGIRPEFPQAEAPVSLLTVEPVTLPVDGRAGKKLALPLAVLLALTGGVFGIIPVIPLELPHVFELLAAILWAPVFEELAKPAGVYVLLARWPATLTSRWRTAALCALGGLAFGLVESCIYVYVYFPDHSLGYLLFRFTVPPLMHTVASFVFGLGLTTDFFANVGRGLRPKATSWAFFLAAMLIHAYYNREVILLAFFHQVFNELR